MGLDRSIPCRSCALQTSRARIQRVEWKGSLESPAPALAFVPNHRPQAAFLLGPKNNPAVWVLYWAPDPGSSHLNLQVAGLVDASRTSQDAQPVQVPMSSIPDSVTNFVSKISLGNPLYIRAAQQQQTIGIRCAHALCRRTDRHPQRHFCAASAGLNTVRDVLHPSSPPSRKPRSEEALGQLFLDGHLQA